ncbi:MAG: hypothetical protein R3B91_01370 [Planctomycetaceae bacterium]
MRFHGLLFAAFGLCFMLGCPQEPPPAAPPGGTDAPAGETPAAETAAPAPEEPAAPAADPDDEASVAGLEEFGVQLKRNKAGNIVAIDVEGARSFGDEQVPLLKGLPALEDVDISMSQVSNDGLAILKDIETIKSLKLRRCANVDDEGIAYLVSMPHLEKLILLYNSNSISDNALESIGKITTLKVLDLRGCVRISDVGLAHLSGLTNLVDLRLKTSGVSDEGVAHLEPLKKLRVLHLEQTRVTGEGLAALSGMTDLTELNLYNTQVDDEGLSHLSEMSKLKWLRLRDTATLGTGLASLEKSRDSLQTLDMSESFVDDSGLAEIAKFPNLESLNLWAGTFTGDGLNQITSLTKLKELNLQSTDVSDDTLDIVAQLSSLENLNLMETRISSAGLAKLHGLKNLKSINLANTDVDDAGITALKEAIPNLDVQT